MNYKAIYENLIKLCKETTPKERLMSRNKNDVRLDGEYIYTENHHIIPKHDGGTDDENNLVTLLPEEHYLAHLIRYKAFGQRNDFLAVRVIVNGFEKKSSIDHLPFNKKIGVHKHMIAKFRKTVGWQSEDGRRRISNARKGTFPCVDAETGEAVGSHTKDHPNVISGKWVHHSKGKVLCIDENGNRVYITTKERRERGLDSCTKGSQVGSKNTNFKELTPERKQRLYALVPKCISENHVVKNRLVKALKEEFTEFKRISIVWVNNNFGSMDKFVDTYNKETGNSFEYNAYYRSPEQREIARKALEKIHERRYNNG